MTKAILFGAATLALAVTCEVAAGASNTPTIERLRGCLSIDNMTKERLDCYDGIVPPEPIAAAPRAKTVLECRFLREEDQRIICFNSFVRPAAAVPAAPGRSTVVVPTTPGRPTAAAPAAPVRPSAEGQPSSLKVEIDVVSKAPSATIATGHGGGCGSRGGPGYRLASGKCASWHESSKHASTHHSAKHRQ
jgi:hypothetical protein